MKKLVYLFAVVAAVLTSCDPLEDVNDEVDAIPQTPNVGSFEYILTDEDYETLEIDVAFESEDQAKLLIPDLLDELYALYGEGTTVNVGYDLFVGDAEGISDFITSDTYDLQNSDYASFGSDAFGFYPNETPEDFIPEILNNQIDSPVEDDLVLVTFEQYIDDPVVGLANFYQATFPTDYDSFELVSVSGPDELGWTVGSANVQGSGFDGAPNALEEWLISPEINLEGLTDLKFQITQEIDFLGDDTLIDIMVSTNYTTGTDPMMADWTALPFDKTIYGNLTTSEDFDFSAYDGETIHVGLKYSSTDSDSPRWRVQDFAIRTVGIEGDTEDLGEYYTYSGSAWELTDDVYYLSSADYDSMGEESGQPGRFDNFSNSTPPENYLPQFLDILYPFAQEEDEIFIIYKFFDGGISRQGNLYTFTDGQWVGDTDIIATTLQFGFSDGEWVPDNTIRYALIESDYDLIVTELTGVEGFEAAVGNLDSFGNFNRTGGSTNWTDEMILTGLNFVLDNLDPTAEEGQKYVVTIATWAPGNSTEEFAVIKEGGEWVLQAE